MRIHIRLGLAVSTMAVAALGMVQVLPVNAQTTKVTGTISYRDRSALPDNAEITIQLADVSRQDVAATVIAEQKFTSAGRQVPFPFELAYDLATIDDRFTYAVQATITVDGKLLYRNTQAYLVITQNRPTNMDVVVSRVGDATEQPTVSAPITILPVTPTPAPAAGGAAPTTTTPQALPTTGSENNILLVLGIGALALLAGGLFVRSRMSRRF